MQKLRWLLQLNWVWTAPTALRHLTVSGVNAPQHWEGFFGHPCKGRLPAFPGQKARLLQVFSSFSLSFPIVLSTRKARGASPVAAGRSRRGTTWPPDCSWLSANRDPSQRDGRAGWRQRNTPCLPGTVGATELRAARERGSPAARRPRWPENS